MPLILPSKLWSGKRRFHMARKGENIYKRKDGRYEGRFIIGYDISGKAKYCSVYAKSYTDVKKKMQKYRSRPQSITRKSSFTLSEWMNIWLSRKNNIKLSTQKLYRRIIDNHITPQIGKIALRNLSSDTIQCFISSLALAPATVKLIYTVLKAALKSAEEEKYIENVYSRISAPGILRKEPTVLTRSEQHTLECSLATPNDIGILICLYTGLRIGELCALKWENIDLDNALLHVCGTQSRIDGKLIITPPKSSASQRIIPIPSVLLNKLRSHSHNGSFVLYSKNGMMDVRTYRRNFKRILKRASLPNIKFHALRHIFATRSLELGVDYKTLSIVLGHSSVKTTMDLYVHPLDEHIKIEMNKLNSIYSPSS